MFSSANGARVRGESSRYVAVLFSVFFVVLLSGCAVPSGYHTLRDPRYWERSNISEAIHITPPYLQTMLDRDISACVFEIREDNRSAAIRSSFPADISGDLQEDAPGRALGEWETPERSGALRAEHGDYHDFEGCMAYKGWRRVDTIPPDIAEKSRKNYLKHLGEDPEPKRSNPESQTSSGGSYLNF